MQRLRIYLAFIALAVVAAGVFGAVHDEISYTVSQEYFTKFKFLQFRLLDSDIPERIRAARVGFLASWWMGIPLGVLAGLGGFAQRTPSQMWRALLWSLPVLVTFTLAIALLGLAYGLHQTETFNLGDYAGWYLPPALDHPRRFLCAGYMHNSAYIGGALSIPVAWAFHLVYRFRSH
jgi:hypothetical protein